MPQQNDFAVLGSELLHDFRALALEGVGPLLHRGQARLRFSRLAKAKRHARDLEQRANLIVGELRQEIGEKRASGLADDRVAQRACPGPWQVGDAALV